MSAVTGTSTARTILATASNMGTRWQIFWKIRMPNALPYIFAGMKISITLAIIGVIVSEFVASQEGIGYLIKLAGGLLDTPLMMAAITVLSISGLALYGMPSLPRSCCGARKPPANGPAFRCWRGQTTVGLQILRRRNPADTCTPLKPGLTSSPPGAVT